MVVVQIQQRLWGRCLCWWFPTTQSEEGYGFNACSDRFTGEGSKGADGTTTRVASPISGRRSPSITVLAPVSTDASVLLQRAHPSLLPPERGDTVLLDEDAATNYDAVLRQLLVYDPAARPSARELLRNGFLARSSGSVASSPCWG